MISLFRVLLCALMAFSMTFSMSFAKTMRSSNAAKSVTLTQTVVGSTSTLAATSGKSSFDSTGSYSSGGGKGEEVANPSMIGALSFHTYPDGIGQSALIAQAKTKILDQVDTLAGSIRNYLATNGLSFAMFHYDQKIMVGGGAPNRPKHLVWSLLVGRDSMTLYGDPKLVDEDPLIVHVIYTSRAMAEELPSEWAYPDAGTIKYQLMNSRFQPQTEWKTIDVAGAYDEPAGDGEDIDIDAGLRCLINSTSEGCALSANDVRSLVEANAAIGAVVDYARALSPKYDLTVENGETYHVPRLSLSVDKRKANTPSACTADNVKTITYENEGQYGYLLESVTDRYYVQPDMSYYQADHLSTESLSPTKDYKVSRGGIDRAQRDALAGWVVDPVHPDGPLLDAASLNAVFLAPVEANGDEGSDKLWTKTDYVSGMSHKQTAGYLIECDEEHNKIRVAVGILDDAVRTKIKAIAGYDQKVTYAEFTPGVASSSVSITEGSGKSWRPIGKISIDVGYDGVRTFRFTDSFIPIYSSNGSYVNQVIHLANIDGLICPPGGDIYGHSMWGDHMYCATEVTYQSTDNDSYIMVCPSGYDVNVTYTMESVIYDCRHAVINETVSW